MQLFVKKAMKQEKQLRAVPREIQDALLRRYLRYCQDQYVHTRLEWRDKMKKLHLDMKETTILGIRLSFLKEEYPIKLVCSKGEPC